jgi:PAS domain S-box-containing protein
LASVLALMASVSAVWILYQGARQADDSNQLVLHTQEVLDQLELMLGRLLTADAVVRNLPTPSDPAQPDPMAGPERAVSADVDRIALLTADNAVQQQRVPLLRQRVGDVFAALRAVVRSKQNGGDTAREAADTVAASLSAARAVLRDMRIEEDRLLRIRAEADRTGIHRLQWIAGVIGTIALALLAAVFWLFLRDVRHHGAVADALRQTTHNLREQVGDRTADLRAANARLRSIIDSAVDGIIVIDADGRIESFNQSAERLFGYSSAEVIGRNVKMLMPSPYHEEHDGYLSRYLETGARQIIGLGRQVSGLRRDGTSFPLQLSVGEHVVNGERKFTGILHDLSVRVQMEEQLREQETLVRLGEMAAVLAHEVKNPLAGIRGAIQVVGSRLPKDSRDAAVVHDIVSRIDGLNELMKDLLLFARPPQVRRAAVELGPLISTTADLLGRDPAFEHLHIHVTGGGPTVDGDPELLKIVFVNLMINAAHAMKNRGAIEISLRTFGDRCEVVCSDHGPGIPPDVREKIFQPFFTTKARGTGLGLPTARRLIEAHDGTISIVCPPEGGTRVTIQLPARTEAMSA